MAYATESDVTPLLGDLVLPSTLSIGSYVNRGADEIDLWLGLRYIVPIEATDYYTQRLLATANAELAAAHIFLAQASGGEDNKVNAYGLFLYERAQERIAPYLEAMQLPGVVLRPQPALGAGPIAILQQDDKSLLTAAYGYFGNRPKWYAYSGQGYRSDHRS